MHNSCFMMGHVASIEVDIATRRTDSQFHAYPPITIMGLQLANLVRRRDDRSDVTPRPRHKSSVILFV